MSRKLTRRQVLLGASLASTSLLVACQPKIVEVEKIVEKEVEKLVEHTVVVKEAVEVEKEVTRVVEKEVERAVEAARAPLKGKVIWETFRGPGTGWNEERMESFKSMYPDVEFEFRPMASGDYARMYTEYAAGDLGDLICWDPGHLVFQAAVENGMIVPIDDFVSADPGLDLADWYDTYMTMMYYQGKMYGFPSWCWSGHDTLVTNKVHLEEEGIDAPPPDSFVTPMHTIAEWIQKTHKVGRTADEVDRWGATIGPGLIFTACVIRAFGSDVLTDDGTRSLIAEDENTAAGFKWLYDLCVVDKVMSPGGDVPGNMATAFAEELMTMQHGGALNIARSIRPAMRGKEDRVDPTTIYYPRRSDGQLPSFLRTGAWHINSQTQHPEICYEFNKHLASHEGALGFTLIAGEGGITRPDVFEFVRHRDPSYDWSLETHRNGMQPPYVANTRGREVEDAMLQFTLQLLDRRQPIPFEQGLEQLHNAVQNVLSMPPP